MINGHDCLNLIKFDKISLKNVKPVHVFEVVFVFVVAAVVAAAVVSSAAVVAAAVGAGAVGAMVSQVTTSGMYVVIVYGHYNYL